MMHHHSAAMNHLDVDAMGTRCRSSCNAVALLDLSRKPTAQVRVAQAILELDVTNKVKAPDIATAFGSNGGPPIRFKALPAFNILRI